MDSFDCIVEVIFAGLPSLAMISICHYLANHFACNMTYGTEYNRNGKKKGVMTRVGPTKKMFPFLLSKW